VWPIKPAVVWVAFSSFPELANFSKICPISWPFACLQIQAVAKKTNTAVGITIAFHFVERTILCPLLEIETISSQQVPHEVIGTNAATDIGVMTIFLVDLLNIAEEIEADLRRHHLVKTPRTEYCKALFL
jgi:hypothetical protein